MPPAELVRLVGRYQLSPGPLIAVTLDGGVLRVRNESVPGAQAFPVYAEAPLAFFWKVVDAQIRFTTDETGKVTGAELSQGGQTMAGPKIEL